MDEFYELKAQGARPMALDIKKAIAFLNEALDLVYPGMARRCFHSKSEFYTAYDLHLNHYEELLGALCATNSKQEYGAYLPVIMKAINEDVQALVDGDPAAVDFAEVLLTYPGPYAIAIHRLAHYFYEKKIPVLPRLFSEHAHQKTGIDIHPGAEIGKGFFIDHGTGIVIGETTVIGDRVKIYQGVTLGALSVEKNKAHKKRHPTIHDDCVIYAHATILGGETVVGEHSVIGGNVWLTKSVGPQSIVYHKSEIKYDTNKEKIFEEISYEI